MGAICRRGGIHAGKAEMGDRGWMSINGKLLTCPIYFACESTFITWASPRKLKASSHVQAGGRQDFH
jgi:hypothetical protein